MARISNQECPFCAKPFIQHRVPAACNALEVASMRTYEGRGAKLMQDPVSSTYTAALMDAGEWMEAAEYDRYDHAVAAFLWYCERAAEATSADMGPALASITRGMVVAS